MCFNGTRKNFFEPETYEMVVEWRRLIDGYNSDKGGVPRDDDTTRFCYAD